ncbi:hypothetical protein K2X33_09245 [bacterium]|nr:hypothetical protein [bacterium]
MIVQMQDKAMPQFGMIHPEFEILVRRIIETVDKDRLADLRKDFHTRLRLTLTQPDNADLIEDLWDFFYDWCVFEQQLPEMLESLTPEERTYWRHIQGGSTRSLFTVAKSADSGLKLKDLYSGKSYVVPRTLPTDFLGINKGDIVEGRLISRSADLKQGFDFVRRPSYHLETVHPYIKSKVKQFKKSQDYSTYQSWLWILVGMYLKHRIYPQMPIDKIYDDNSRI